MTTTTIEQFREQCANECLEQYRKNGTLFAAASAIRALPLPTMPEQAEPVKEKRAPVQGFAGGIPWDMHLRAYDVYCKRWSPQKALIEGGCRGGFSTGELDMFIPGWREELSERTALLARVAELEAALKRIAKWHGEFPDTGKTWEDGTPISYESSYGSNGERDYMRSVAQQALESGK